VVTHGEDTKSTYAVAIVTGGSLGAGREIARTLAGQGYAVVVVYMRDQEEAEAAVEEMLAANCTALAIRADVTDELDVERLFRETAAAFGGVDVVVQTAIRGNSVVNGEAARQLRRGGAIVTLSTAQAIAPGLAGELCARNITVNGGVPGLEAPGANHQVADLVTYLERWRSRPGALTRVLTGANGGKSREPRAAPPRNAPRAPKSAQNQARGGRHEHDH
jgi:hypothetical protein